MDVGSNQIQSKIRELIRSTHNISLGDLTTWTDVFPILDALCVEPQIPSAFHSQVNRVKKMVETAIMGDSPMNTSMAKLKEVLGKMVVFLQQLAPLHDKPDIMQSPISVSQEDADINADLINKFIANQKIQLEDFEMYVLEMEKGNDAAKEEVRRYLHTIKGEFGVLDLGEYADLVHMIEDAFLGNLLSMDHMFRFKDWLMSIFPALSVGTIVHLQSGDYAQFGIQLDAETPRAASSATAFSDSKILKVPVAGRLNASHLDASFFADFITESREHLHTMETKLLDLEADATSEEPINAVFRACHTIKGLAGFLDLAEIQKLSHAVENLMDRARNRQLTLTVSHTDLLLMSADCLKELVNGVEAFLKGENVPVPASYEDMLYKLANLDENQPLVLAPVLPTTRLGEILVDAGLISPKTVDVALEKQKAGDSRKIGEILIMDEGISPRNLGQALGAQVQAKQQSQMQGIEESVRVPVARLDQLIDAIGEAVIAQSMIYADRIITDLDYSATVDERDALRRKVARAELIIRQIQELSMSLRMVSIKAVFQKMARLVRDLSKKLDKKVEFITDGENTELDKSVVENIADPLVHMVRNALDHGIESTEERLRSGKPEVSKVVLRAYHKAGNVFIEIEDDGRGLNREVLIKKAVEQRLIPAGAILTDQEVYQLIFAPGFSTAAKVTDVSGRGVGMDVVKRNIEALRGSVEITSELGKGSKFAIRLPLTLAIIDGMVIRVGRERFIIPTLQVIETIKPAADQIESILGKGEIIRIRSEIIRVVRLAQVLGVSGSNMDIREGIVMVVEDAAGQRCGLAADEILDQQQVVIKNMGSGMVDVPGISGGAIMNNGEISLILDVSGVMRLSKEVIIEGER